MRWRSLARDRRFAYELAVEAYYYLYPLVLMDVTRRQMTSVASADEVVGRAPANQFAHLRRFPPIGYRDVVRTNFDTLYSFAWLDLRAGPVTLTIPDAGDHYYMLPMYDMWSDVFADPGTRTSGNWPVTYTVTTASWHGELPAGSRRLDAPTPHVWIIGRMQCAGADEYGHVNRFQEKLAIAPLAAAPQPEPCRPLLEPPVDSATPPPDQVDRMSPIGYLAYAAELLKTNRPHPPDHPVLERIERLGLAVGESFEAQRLPRAVIDVLRPAFAESRLELHRRSRLLGWEANGWLMNTETMGAWGTDFLKRAAVDRIGLSAALPEDIIYPTAFVDGGGEPLHGRNRYRLRFTRDALPPARAFWSLTLYDANGYVVPNDAGRYTIRSVDDLAFNRDGSLEIAVQQHPSAVVADTNWLPSFDGEFNLCLRLYWPEQAALDRTWAPPPIRRLDFPARRRRRPERSLAED